MTDTEFGYLILGAGIVLVLGLVYAAASRGGRPHATPPPGVHMPGPSWLPFQFAAAAALLGAGLAFRPDDQIANWFLLIPGLILLVVTAVGWIRAAGREWRETEDGPSHGSGHGAGH
jgi:hypothetical protein